MRRTTTPLYLLIATLLLCQSHLGFAANPSCPASTEVSGFPLPSPWIESNNENLGFTVSQPQQDIWLHQGKEYYRCVYIYPAIPNRNDRVIYVNRQIPVNLSALEKLQYFKSTACPTNSFQINVGLNVISPWLKSNFTYTMFNKYMYITNYELDAAAQQYADANNISVYKGRSTNEMFCGYAWGFPSGTNVKKLAITRPVDVAVAPGSFAPNPTSSAQHQLIAPTAVPGQAPPAMHKKPVIGTPMQAPVVPTRQQPPSRTAEPKPAPGFDKKQPSLPATKAPPAAVRLGAMCNSQTFPNNAEVSYRDKKQDAQCVNGKVEVKQRNQTIKLAPGVTK